MWIILGIGSALFLSFYNLCKKKALKDNDAFSVLLLNTFFAFVFFNCLEYAASFNENLSSYFLRDELSLKQISLISIKSLIITGSWSLGFYVLKTMPIALVNPIRNSSPLVTLMGAILIFGESPTFVQWLGVALILWGVVSNSLIKANQELKFVWDYRFPLLILSTLLGASSGLYDKFLISNQSISPQSVQYWFSGFNLLFSLMVYGVYQYFWVKHKGNSYAKPRLTWSVAFIGVFLILSDLLYFNALKDPDSLLILLSSIKKSQLILTVGLAAFLFKERNFKKRIFPLVGILLGVILISIG